MSTSPKILITELHLQFNELYWLIQGDGFYFWQDVTFREAYQRMMDELIEAADEVMEYGGFPSDASDRDLITLSYKLPPALSLAMLRHRLIRGLALRDMRSARGEKTEDPLTPALADG